MRAKFVLIAACCAASAMETASPVAIVTAVSPGAKLLRAGSELPILAKPTDLLFAGDSLSGTASVAACGATSALHLAGTVRVERPVPCVLPPVSYERSPDIGPGLTRSLVDSDGISLKPEIGDLPDSRRAAIERQLASIPGDGVYERVARAEVLAKAGLPADAAAAYALLRREVPSSRELATARMFVLEQESARKRAPKVDPTIGGKTYALLIGISEFQNAQIRPLKYAHEDALLFESFLKSPRGGNLPDDDITVLTNERATTAAVRTAFDTILGRASAADTVLVLIATHGTVVENPRSKSRGAFIVTYDSDPEDLGATALPMSAVQKFIREDLAKTARVLAFVDACRSGTIGTIPDKSKIKINAALDSLTQADSQLFLFTASRPGEISFEGLQYGGGHGAFSFFLLEALNGGADIDSDNKVTINEMVGYVQQKVAEATVDKQHPREGGTLDATVRVADLTKPGISIGPYRPGVKNDEVSRGFEKTRGSAVRVVNIRQAVDFDEALSAGRLLPDEPANAFAAFRQLKLSRRLSRDQVLAQENRLRVALEDRNQQALLRYLQGDQKPMTKADYAKAAGMVSAAIQINGETPALSSRLLFCEGRVAIFDKRYAQARDLLESALRLDPDAAYIYNALGTAYLEQGDFELAETALREAMQRAPLWSYPRHNLALTLAERGDTERAIQIYDDAIRLAPQHGYLVYNQALLLQRINRKDEAESKYRRAAEVTPEMAEPYNALGTLRAEQGRRTEAESFYRDSLKRNTNYVEARQNLAVLLWKEKGRQPEAIALWKENLALDETWIPSRLSLASALAESGQAAEAIRQYLTLLDHAPDFVAARLNVAKLLASGGRLPEARVQLDEARKREPASPIVLEALADFEVLEGRKSEAASYYRAALAEAPGFEQKKRLNSKLRGMAR